MTVDRVGPTSAISAKKTTKATAVQTTAKAMTASVTLALGIASGACAIPNGRYASAVSSTEAVMTPRPETSESQRDRISGPAA